MRWTLREKVTATLGVALSVLFFLGTCAVFLFDWAAQFWLGVIVVGFLIVIAIVRPRSPGGSF